MKVKKGDKIYPFITGDDVIITKGVNHPGQTVDDAFEEVDETLEEHKKKIDRLESNMKHLYSYGGVGGNGRGGSGGGSSTGSPILFISLNGRQIQSGSDNVIVLNEPGDYILEGSVSNNGGNTFFVDVKYGPNKNREIKFTLDSDNRWRIEPTSLKLTSNGEISISFSDTEGGISQINQRYIVYPHTFTSKFMYEYDNGSGDIQYNEFSPYEYFIGNSSQRNPFIDISFRIDILNVTHIQVKYDIVGTDGTDNNISYESITSENPITCGHGKVSFETTNITDNHLRIYLDNLTRNDERFTNEVNNGTYNVSVTFSYIVNGNEQIQTIPYDITLIPNNLYIYVRNSQGIMYDTLEDLQAACDEGANGIPTKYVNIGSYTSFYCKVFEGPMVNDANSYYLEFNVYDYVDGEYVLKPEMYNKNSDAIEQVETDPPFSVAFQSKGIKKIEFSTQGRRTSNQTVTTKYIFVNEPEHEISGWYPDNLEQSNFYFRANRETNINSEYLRSLLPFETSEKNRPITISDNWTESDASKGTTILSFGIQYSAVNKDGAKILEVYGSSNTPIITLYSNKLFDVSSSGDSDKKICIPSESKFNKSVNTQYHLVQIVRHLVGVEGTQNKYASYLYIDGKLESNKTGTDNNPMRVNRIVFNNVNAVYNLINIQYVKLSRPSLLIGANAATRASILTIDEVIYQYYLAYKDIMGAGTVSDAETTIFNSLSSIKFDGTNVIVDADFVKSVSPKMTIPTMVMEYIPKKKEDGSYDQDDIDKMVRDLFRGYGTASNDFGQRGVILHWCSGSGSSYVENVGPSPITDTSGNVYTATWYVELQGTSTMRNRIKNFSLGLDTTSDTGGTKNILMSPNYDPDDSSTFLPEQIWTLKADIADSAHANNTSVGKFVNRVCTKFSKSNGLNPDEYGNVLSYIKNTLEGFPILMYFKVAEEVYYLGVYNFNMGRNSYYNLGYHTAADTIPMVEQIRPGKDTSPFRYSVGSDEIPSTLAIGEIQDNHPQFDFHQYDSTVLFGKGGMFGPKSKITGAGDKDNAISTLSAFVKSVARAGAYCFSNIGKVPVPSKEGEFEDDTKTGNNCMKRYSYKSYLDGNGDTRFYEYVPDVSWQYSVEDSSNKWYNPNDPGLSPERQANIIRFEDVQMDIDNLLQCISDTDKHGDEQNGWNHLDYTSLSEYYTVCMAFGLVDSVLKNMNIKSWDGKKCYIAFYDMDCALGENNLGVEDVTYLAASDYWYSPTSNGYIENVKIHYDYWEETIGKGFDYPSSYLFAIAKYAQAMVNTTLGLNLTRYPQQFWAELRCPDSNPDNPAQGELRSADYFVNKYFSSGIGQIPAYLASLNYQVKYLYYGKKTDEDGNESSESAFLVNGGAFNGSRLEKVKEWLRKRLHFLDFMFNIQAIDISIGSIYLMPLANTTTLANVKLNPDVVILTDAFTGENNGVLIQSNSEPVDVWAPMNTPFIVARGSSSYMFLLCSGTGVENPIRINTTRSEPIRFYGSKEFTDLSKVEPFITNEFTISSNAIERIVYGGMDMQQITSGLKVVSTSIKTIKLNIPTYSGTLNIPSDGLNGQALTELDIHDSGLIGEWRNLSNLRKLNISSVNNYDGNIRIAECPIVGDDCIISGKDNEHLTTLRSLEMSGVEGNFMIEKSSIERISFTATKDREASFEINGDERLNELRLTGFKKVVITGCPNIETLYIDEHPGTSVCETIIINIPDKKKPDGSEQDDLKMFNSNEDINGVFDFTKYESLKTLGFSGSKKAVVIKIPDHKVSIVTFKDNKNLEFVDTVGEHSCIELTQDSTFYNCPRYSMKQSWADDDNLNNDGVNIRTLTTDTYSYIHLKNTKMCIGESCISLAATFDKIDSGIVSNYKTTPYVNEWGQKVNNSEITSDMCAWFINDVVGGKPIDDAWLEHIDSDTDIIHDSQGTKVRIGLDRRSQIISLQRCFNKQNGIIIVSGTDVNFANLSEYTSLDDISSMYNGTGVKYLSSGLLSLPDSRNNNNSENDNFNWTDFIGNGNLKIAKDALKHISYRINGLLQMTLTVCNPENHNDILNSGDTEPVTDEDWLDMRDILCPQEDPEHPGQYIPFTRITTFSQFSINSNQWVDYTHLFEICPNVISLNGFLNSDLSRVKIDGILKPCKKLDNIVDSFNHTGDVDSLRRSIDLYEFFDWENPEVMGIHKLFESQTRLSPGFSIKKHISNENFASIISVLHNYTNIEKLMNLFSYCTINGYDGSEIKLEGDMDRVLNINALFYHCKCDNNRPLKIRRSFFEHLKNVTSLVNTFSGVYFDHMLSYDFFCKRIQKPDPNVYVLVDGSYQKATLNTYEYRDTLINDLYNCFGDVKFYGCKSWFDVNDGNSELKPDTDTVTYNGNNYTTYYKSEPGGYVEYHISDPDEVVDTLNNFTNYVDKIDIRPTETRILNHNIENDLSAFNNNQGDWKPYVIPSSSIKIYPTYCCLPPDIFYGCRFDCNLIKVFSNTNIIGVIPKHLLKGCYNSELNNMFQNVNILPNLMYHYDSNTANDEIYQQLISDVPVDESYISGSFTLLESSQAVVLYRDSNGELKRRRPIDNSTLNDNNRMDGDYSKSQFAYVPQGYVTNENLQEAFTFRYNLPDQVNLYESQLAQEGIYWNQDTQTSVGVYDKEYSPELRPELWPYYTQYFFTVDESISWRRVRNMSMPFINDSQDVSFVENTIKHIYEPRVFSVTDRDYTNRWWEEFTIVNSSLWDQSTTHRDIVDGNAVNKGGVLNVFLNLCGKRDTRTGRLTDNGCLINEAMNNYPRFDTFVSGPLITFLNGRIFDANVDGGRFTTSNASVIIPYSLGFARNIVFPQLNISSGNISNVPKVIVSHSSEISIFYRFMFPNESSLKNYQDIYNIGATNLGTGSKYKVLP